jgi:hypothetical protein
MKMLRTLIAILIMPLAVMAITFQPVSAFDLFPTDTVCSGQAAKSPACQQAAGQSGKGGGPVVDIINTAANIIALITGIGGVIMIILGGFSLVTSGGNAEAVATGRRRIIYSLVGMLIVAFAWAITRFITDKLIQ